ncbi:MAG: hypothetical protein WD895_05935 [Acidimicrobiia bacterium]
MAEFETKLRWLSERGNPVGAEELIERIEADLAGDPLVVVAKRREGTLMTKTQQSPTTSQPSRYRGPAWALAAFVAVLAVAAAFFAFAGDDSQVADNPPPPPTVAPDVETMTDLEVIEAGVAAFYSGDAERVVDLFDIAAFRVIGEGYLEDPEGYDPILDEAGIRRETAYQAAIGGRLTLNCTEGITPGVFTCKMPYHNALTDAVGYVDSPSDSPWDNPRVVVHDGVITEFYVPEHEFLRAAVGRFLTDQQVDGYEDCVEAGRLVRTPECANVIMAHLDDWAAWCGRIVTKQDPIWRTTCENQ